LKKSLRSSSIIDDIRFALSSRFVITIIAISTICRIIFHFFILPNSPSNFGPDEGSYAALAKYVSEGLSVEDFPGFGPGLYNTAKSIILPSAFLVQVGMGELSAVRTIASTYGLASSLVLVLCFLALSKLRNQKFQKSGPVFDRKSLILLSIFTFFPSNFVWSIIGLRESGSQFWLMTTFYLILKLIDSAGRDSLKFTVLCSLALTMAHATRPYTALVFSIVALLTLIVLQLKIRKFLPVIAILLGVFGGQSFTTTPQVAAEESLGAFKIIDPGLNQSLTPKPVEILVAKQSDSASVKCSQADEIISFEGSKFRCKSYKTYQVIERNPTKTLENKLVTTQILEYKRNANTINAQSALPISNCQGPSPDIFRLIKCNLSALPYRLFAFLFRPLIFFDQGSTTLTFAALENLGWMILVPLSIWVSLRRRENTVDRFINLGLTAYVLLFASAAALYEGNLGTAFRHKSTILWPLILILMIAPRILIKLKRKTTSVP
jgi:hypothetical protein